LGFIPAIIIILLNPIKFDKYKVEYNDRITKNQSYLMIWYEDLDNDGLKETLRIGNNLPSSNNLFLYVHNSQEELIGQFNFPYKKAITRNQFIPFSADINGDRIKETFLFTQKQDSIYLNVFDFAKRKVILSNRFITIIGGYNEHIDFNIGWIGAEDVTGDCINEVFFQISAGFALYPRRYYRYDFVKDSLIKSINMGAGLLHTTLFYNENKDFIIIAGSNATNNVSENYPYPYSDSCCWVFGFNKDLKFTFDPIQFIGKPAGISKPIQSKGLIYSSFSGNKTYGDSNQLFWLDYSGKIESFKTKNNLLPKTIFVKDNSILLQDKNNWEFY